MGTRRASLCPTAACVCAAWAAVLGCVADLRADGCMMVRERETTIASSPKQEAILIAGDGQVDVILRTHFRNGPSELAWVVPVPAKPTGIEKSSDAVFDVLQRATAPRFITSYRRPPEGISCGCGAMAPQLEEIERQAVVVEGSGTAGIFEYVVLSAGRADELTGWLKEHKYVVPAGAEKVFDRYVRDGWHWLAMRIRPEEVYRGTLAPHPIQYTYQSDRLVYPLVISQFSADTQNEIVLYVVGHGRYACGNWTNATIDRARVKAKAGSRSGSNYEDLFASATRENDGRLFVTEFASARAPDGSFSQFTGGVAERVAGKSLTRLRAVMTPAAMDRDVLLVPVEWGDVNSRYRLAEAGGHTVPVVPLAAAGVCLLLGVRLIGTMGWRRACGAAFLAAGCCAFAMI